jgi:hypothetical protein
LDQRASRRPSHGRLAITYPSLDGFDGTAPERKSTGKIPKIPDFIDLDGWCRKQDSNL